MDSVEHLSEVHFSEPGGNSVRSGEQRDTVKLTLEDCRPFRVESIEQVADLIKKYAELALPIEAPLVFASHLTQRPDAWFVELGEVGLFYLTNIVLHFAADANVVFWDRRFGRDRRDVVQSLVCSAFDLFDLKRIQARIPAVNVPLRTQLQRSGFKEEGVLRSAWIDENGLQSLHVLSMIREERPECRLLPLAISSERVI